MMDSFGMEGHWGHLLVTCLKMCRGCLQDWKERFVVAPSLGARQQVWRGPMAL